MAKTDVTVDDILKNSIAYLYIFRNFTIPGTTETYLQWLGQKTAYIIDGKGKNQEQLVKNVAKDSKLTETELYEKIRAKIEEEYGMGPYEILMRLALGETIAGKNFVQGTYGIGALAPITDLKSQTIIPSSTYSLANYNVATGRFNNNYGNVLATPIVGKRPDGRYGITGYTSVFDDKYTVTSSLNANGLYNITSVGSETAQQKADGTAFNNSQSSNIWATMGTYLPFIGMILQLLMGLLTGFKNINSSWGTSGLLGGYTTYPCQKDYLDTDEGMTTSDLLLLAAAAGAVYLIASSSDDNSEE